MVLFDHSPAPSPYLSGYTCMHETHAYIYELQYLYSVSQVKLSSWQPHSQGRELKRKDNGNEILMLSWLDYIHYMHFYIYSYFN
jgi:hypothetical protein